MYVGFLLLVKEKTLVVLKSAHRFFCCADSLVELGLNDASCEHRVLALQTLASTHMPRFSGCRKDKTRSGIQYLVEERGNHVSLVSVVQCL